VIDGPREFDTRGQLVIGGVTNEISMAITFASLPAHQLKLSGTAILKMTDFQIEPPSPKITIGLIKTGDEVKLSFEWVLDRRD
jgi:polyisoprenoid-binding protein YceI